MLERLVSIPLELLPERLVSRVRNSRSLAPLLERAVSVASRPLHGRIWLVRHGEAAGLRFRIGPVSTVWASGRIELAVQRALRGILRPGDVFYDVGANVGFFTILGARLVGPTGTVAAFEPLPANVEALRRNVELNRFANVLVYPLAVSGSTGKQWLHAKHPSTAAVVGDSAPARAGVQVNATSLDDFVLAHPQLRPAVVKIDVEGHETEVLRGMRRTLRECRPTLVCELHGAPADFARELAGAGYGGKLLDASGALERAPLGAHVLASPAAGSR